MRRAGDAGQLRVRILSYASGIDNLLAVAGTRPTPWLYDGRLRMVGVKLYLDGALGSRGAWLKQPYRDAPGQRGLPLVNDTVLKNLMSRAAMDNFQVAVHAIGDQANADPARRDRGARRTPITATGAGGSSMPRSSIPPTCRASPGTAIIASMQPIHQTSDRLMAEARMGIERLQGAYAWRCDARQPRAARLRLRFPGREPQPVPRPRRRDQPRGCARAAAGRLAAAAAADAGAGLRRLHPRRRLSPASPRTGSARSSPAGMADFIFVDRDIFAEARPARRSRETQVLETYVGGQQGLGAAALSRPSARQRARRSAAAAAPRPRGPAA